MFHAPNEMCWDNEVAAFIDGLVDLDIAYIDVQPAVEQIIHSGLHNELSLPFTHEGQTFFYHRVPPLSPGLRPIDVFTTIGAAGIITVEYICFA